MLIVSIVITCNRTDLLPRALNSIAEQKRKADAVFVISNSTENNFLSENIICKKLGFDLVKNERTKNYAGGLNTGLEKIINEFGIEECIYFASLDDDDEWLPDYLQELENSNDKNYDLIAANLCRKSSTEDKILVLPEILSYKDFLSGNPGISGSNTFVRLDILLFAGAFDEGMQSTIDRDLMVRIFQQNPRYKIINKHLVNQYTDNERDRITTNYEIKKSGLRMFFYKYKNLMDIDTKHKFFERAKTLFNLQENDFLFPQTNVNVNCENISFENKGNYQFIIGFIAGNVKLAIRLINEIISKNVPVDFLLIINNTKDEYTIENALKTKFNYKIISKNEWAENLSNGFYGDTFKRFTEINSIPFGRTILQYHLYNDTINFNKPIYWIIDDDMSLNTTTCNLYGNMNLFDIINTYLAKADALIGGISGDAPVPALSCMRGQLVDFLYSNFANNCEENDLNNLRLKKDYYYDLSDDHTDHLEIPIYYKNANEQNLKLIFMGKSVSRKILQYKMQGDKKTISRRGGNAIIFNRELLIKYPVLNLVVNNKFARRGDLLWSLLSQFTDEYEIYEHTFSLNHNRLESEFDIDKELEKVAYDIIGHAFCKAISITLRQISNFTYNNIFKHIMNKENYMVFIQNFELSINKRKTKFLMNYYRIIGICKILLNDFSEAKRFYKNIFDIKFSLENFNKIIQSSLDKDSISSFFYDMVIKTCDEWEYEKNHRSAIIKYFGTKNNLQKLGKGCEGYVFTDNTFVYKSFFNISDTSWNFLKEISVVFYKNDFLEKIDIGNFNEYRFIRYPYRNFSRLISVSSFEMVSFLKFCKENNFVYTNIASKNFISIDNHHQKLIDYGSSFEPYSEEKLLNATKRAYLMYKYPQMNDDIFKSLSKIINRGQIPKEIEGWEHFWYAIFPRKKEEILDLKILEIIKNISPKSLLDYGAGKCKTASMIRNATGTDVYVYDTDIPTIEKYGQSFPKYITNNKRFDNKFDVVILNIVLCIIDNEMVNDILRNVKKAIKQDGKVIVTICNPDFANVHKTEFQNRDFVPKNILYEEIITKTCVYTGAKKTEYHRASRWYVDIFKKFDFLIEKAIDTDGVNLDTLEFASDFKIFILTRGIK